MSRVFFRDELEPAATFWRVLRRDGVTLGFTSHDRDLWLGGVLHRAAPGMLPSAVRRTADLGADSVDVEGFTHKSHGPSGILPVGNGRHHQDGGRGRVLFLKEFIQELASVHDGHHEVKEDQAWTGLS